MANRSTRRTKVSDPFSAGRRFAARHKHTASSIGGLAGVEEDGSLEEVKRIVKLLQMALVCQA
jgi:hypothetical protein